MSTANQNNTGGASAPGDDIGDDLMQEVASNLGTTLPKTDAKPGASASGTETDEEKAAREQAEAAAGGDESDGTETAEEKAAREKAEAEAGETDEEKAAREQAEAEEAAKNPGAAEKTAAKTKLTEALQDATSEQLAAAQLVVDEIVDNVVKERAEKDRLGARVTELTTELETVQKAKGPTIVGSVNPVFMADDASAIDEREESIEKFERWATRVIRAGGENLPDSEGYDAEKPSYTVEQVEARLDQLLHEKKKILPAARANLQKRAEIDKALRGIYPAIFDPKAPEYAQVQQVLKVLPELKQFADYRVIALKQILGDRALAEILAKRKKESSPQGQKKQEIKGVTQPPKKSPPRAPGGGAPAKGGVLDPKSKQTAAPEALKKVMSDPTDKKAFTAAVGALTADI